MTGIRLSFVDMAQKSNERHFGILVEAIAEKFIVRVKDRGLIITGKEGNSMEFSAGEALMLLDILKEEETELKRIAEEQLRA
jgi:hypothetical protein